MQKRRHINDLYSDGTIYASSPGQQKHLLAHYERFEIELVLNRDLPTDGALWFYGEMWLFIFQTSTAAKAAFIGACPNSPEVTT